MEITQYNNYDKYNKYIIEENSIKYITNDFLELTDVDQMISILEELDVDPKIEIYNKNFTISLYFWSIYHKVNKLSTYLNTKYNDITCENIKIEEPSTKFNNWYMYIFCVICISFGLLYGVFIMSMFLLLFVVYVSNMCNTLHCPHLNCSHCNIPSSDLNSFDILTPMYNYIVMSSVSSSNICNI